MDLFITKHQMLNRFCFFLGVTRTYITGALRWANLSGVGTGCRTSERWRRWRLDASSLKGFRYRSSAAAAATDEEDNDRQTDRHGRGYSIPQWSN